MQRVRDVLKNGSKLAIIGWMDSNHSKFTRGLSHKKVMFYDSTPDVLSDKIGYAIFTKFVGHPDFVRIKRAYGKRVHSVVVQVGHIKAILESCESILRDPLPNDDGAVEASTAIEPVSMNPPPTDLSDDVYELLTKPRSYKMDKMEKFIRMFLAAAKGNRKKPGYVGKIMLGKFREECGIKESNGQLADAGWIVGEVSDGRSNIGWYRAGDRMGGQGRVIVSEAPDDPYEWAKWRVSQKAEVLAKKEAIEADLAEIELAEKAIAQLEALFPKA